MRPLIIAQASSSMRGPKEPLSGRSGQRLADLCGCSLDEFLAAFERVNLITEFPRKSGKGDRFDLKEATLNAAELVDNMLIQNRRTVLLGDQVVEACEFALRIKGYRHATYLKVDYLEWIRIGPLCAEIATCPYPSDLRW